MEYSRRARNDLALRYIIENLDIDILFECFVGLMLRNEVFEHKEIHVVPYENFRRNFINDIVPAPRDKDSDFEEESYFEERGNDFIVMYTSRAAVLDYLPEDFFSNPDTSNEKLHRDGTKKTEAEIEKYRQKVREELESAQRFFRPLEVEYNKIRIQRELEELGQLENFDPILELFWREFPVINEKWRRFVRTLHLVSFVIGDLDKTKALIEYVLERPVTLSVDIEEYYCASKKEQEKLLGTEKIMGFNMFIGNLIYDYQEICTLELSLSSNAEFSNYINETSAERQLLNEIINNYFPLNAEVRLDFSIKPEKNKTEEAAPIPIVGYSTKLGV